MKKITDEILNDYIDNQLDSETIKEVAQAIKKDNDLLSKLSALKIVDNSLRKIETLFAPDDFTRKVMKIILAQSRIIVPKISYFFVSMISILSIFIISVFVFAFLSMKENGKKSISNSYLEDGLQFVKNQIPGLLKILSNDNIITIGLVLTMILLISSYFIFESHKNFKDKLNKITSN